MEAQMETIRSVKALEEAVMIIFQHNFDDDSKTCLITLMKVLDNCLQKPGNEKVRTIKLSNAAFDSKVGSRKGGIEFLEACGFERQTDAPPLLSASDAVGEERLVLSSENEDQSHLITARRLLMTRAIQDLGMKADQLPEYRPPPPPLSTTNTTQTGRRTASTNEFNPYVGHRFDAKSAAVGANLGPDSNYVSPTEQQLQRLQAQQAKLERKMQQPVEDREWRAMRPGEQAPVVATSNNPSSSAQPQHRHGPSDSSLLAARMKKQQQERLEREQGGLTTKAMRDLERMKKHKVYSHVSLTIQFADECKLVGKFLPKEKVKSVQAALLECMVNDDNSEFDLYVAPPRRLLPANRTLQQEGLVPAAKIFVSWKVGSAPNKNAAPGSYLKPHLFSADYVSTEFPTAQAIAGTIANGGSKDDDDASKHRPQKKAAKAANREEDLLRRMMGGGNPGLGRAKKDDSDAASSSKGSQDGGKSGRPKWFKK